MSTLWKVSIHLILWWVKCYAIFQYVLVCSLVGCSLVAGVQMHNALLHFMCMLKPTQVNVQHSLIQGLFFDIIMVVGELTHHALLQSLCKLRATQMNVQHSLIQGLFFDIIMVVGELTHRALLQPLCKLRATQMNVQHSLIQGLFFDIIMVVGELTHCALLQPLCKLRATQMNVQHSLIQGLFLGSTMVVGGRTCCALLYFMFNLKATQMNIQYCLIWKLMQFEFELAIKTQKQLKYLFYKRFRHNWLQCITRWFKKFFLSCKNLYNQTKSDRHKTMDSESKPQTIKATPEHSTYKVSGEFGILD